jgi:hypothetical protein
MIVKRVVGARLQSVALTDDIVVEHLTKQAQLLNEFSSELRDRRLIDYPLLEIPQKDQEEIHGKLNAGQSVGYLFTQQIGTYRPGQVYRTEWAMVIHIDQVQHYSKPEEFPWSAQLSDEEKAEHRAKAPEGFDFVHFSKLS